MGRLYWVLGFVLGMGTVRAQECSGPSEPKRRAVVTFNGLNNAYNYSKNVDSVASSFVHSSDLFIKMQGGSTPPGTREAFLDSAKQIRQDYMATKARLGDSFKPSDYELDLFVTNHGVIYGEGSSATFGIAADPQPSIDAATLDEFARTLPRGIRIRSVMGQCFSSDSTRLLESAVAKADPANAPCFCGVAQAAPGAMSYSYNISSMSFEGRMAEVAGKTPVSLVEDLWDGYWQNSNNEQLGKKFFPQHPGLADNAPMTTSERMVSEYFLAMLGKGGAQVSWDELEVNPSIAKGLNKSHGSHKDLSASVREVLEATEKQRSQFLSHKYSEDIGVSGLVDFVADKVRRIAPKGKLVPQSADDLQNQKLVADARIKCDELNLKIRFGSKFFKATRVRKARSICGKAVKLEAMLRDQQVTRQTIENQTRSEEDVEESKSSSFDMQQPWKHPYLKARAQRIANRGLLEEEFAKNAPAEMVQRFLELRRCELQKFGPGRQTPAANAQAPQTPHR